jgi:hypothetical protein
MRIKGRDLQQIIKEEIAVILREGDDDEAISDEEREEEQRQGVTIKIRPLARSGWKWEKTVGSGPFSKTAKGKAKTEEAAMQAAVRARAE